MFSYFVDDQLGYLINPEITEQHGEQDGPEGCLSIPGVTALRARAAVAVARGVDLDQRPVLVTGTGELARALQHETDHLRGELYIDALTGRERRSVLRQIREQQAGPGQPDPGRRATANASPEAHPARQREITCRRRRRRPRSAPPP